jgi:peptidylprolyl isomerase domain and WD repeat-containing protein 1
MQLARSGGSKTAMDHDAIKLSDALIVSVSYQKRRFYVFSHKDPFLDQDQDDADAAAAIIVNRDVLNEPPTAEDRLLADNGASHHTNANSKLGSEAILRTTMGDIHMKLFAKEVPRTIENFCTHARNGYYNNVIFHRVISSFMLQTGDPLGDGTGGESVWGGEFEDEFVRELRHDRPFTVSMANAGPSKLYPIVALLQSV